MNMHNDVVICKKCTHVMKMTDDNITTILDADGFRFDPTDYGSEGNQDINSFYYNKPFECCDCGSRETIQVDSTMLDVIKCAWDHDVQTFFSCAGDDDYGQYIILGYSEFIVTRERMETDILGNLKFGNWYLDKVIDHRLDTGAHEHDGISYIYSNGDNTICVKLNPLNPKACPPRVVQVGLSSDYKPYVIETNGIEFIKNISKHISKH